MSKNKPPVFKPGNPLKVVNASLSGGLTLEESKRLVEKMKKERKDENKS